MSRVSLVWERLLSYTYLCRERSDNYHFTHIVGHSERMREVFDLVTRVARSETASVLITGESGTGKEVVAHAIHEQSTRASGPFHPLNCAAIASNLLESELFGYEQYAFTDAKKQKRGLLELAEGGTLFLDEIGEMPLEMQTTHLVDPWEQWFNIRPPRINALEDIISRVEKYLVRWALETTKHNRTRAAELRGCAKVDQIRYLMRKYGID